MEDTQDGRGFAAGMRRNFDIRNRIDLVHFGQRPRPGVCNTGGDFRRLCRRPACHVRTSASVAVMVRTARVPDDGEQPAVSSLDTAAGPALSRNLRCEVEARWGRASRDVLYVSSQWSLGCRATRHGHRFENEGGDRPLVRKSPLPGIRPWRRERVRAARSTARALSRAPPGSSRPETHACASFCSCARIHSRPGSSV